MVEIKGVNDIGRGRFIIHYIMPAPCGCFFNRSSLIVKTKDKPDYIKAKKLVEDDIKDKG